MLKVFFLIIWPNLIMTDSQYDGFLSLILTISATLLSIGISIFTLSTAFMVGKKDALKEIDERISQDGNSLSLSKRHQSLKQYVHIMRLVSRFAIISSAFSILSIVSVLIFRQFSFSIYAYLIYIPLIISVVFTCICLFQLIKWFIKQ